MATLDSLFRSWNCVDSFVHGDVIAVMSLRDVDVSGRETAANLRIVTLRIVAGGRGLGRRGGPCYNAAEVSDASRSLAAIRTALAA